ncbi:WGR domain-containing protein [uncultured Bosea sp.]|uniref:WGR domain-containing protein n=1 Tax=uncultured Bosea sp. TaxID=211457 RepID=UPI0025E25F8B|nr:WGR domain-containing protein [uncultured Bosea sp.]
MASFEYSSPSTLYRIDRGRNMQRFYSLSTSPTLFGGTSLVREWGRIGSIGRRRVDLFETTAEAEAAQDEIVRTKRARGYQSDRGP